MFSYLVTDVNPTDPNFNERMFGSFSKHDTGAEFTVYDEHAAITAFLAGNEECERVVWVTISTLDWRDPANWEMYHATPYSGWDSAPARKDFKGWPTPDKSPKKRKWWRPFSRLLFRYPKHLRLFPAKSQTPENLDPYITVVEEYGNPVTARYSFWQDRQRGECYRRGTRHTFLTGRSAEFSSAQGVCIARLATREEMATKDVLQLNWELNYAEENTWGSSDVAEHKTASPEFSGD